MCLAVSSAAYADAPVADTEPRQATLEEVVVTANKREQSIEDVGIAVTALGQQQLATLGRQEMSNLAQFVPSLQIQEQGSPTNIVFNIRGVAQNDYAPHQESPIAFYSDGAYISSRQIPGGMTFDLDRIEVLRGPQGTLFGRNATGGLVQLISAKPTKDFEGFFTATAESYRTFDTEGAISGPINDTVRARLSFTTLDGGGYLKNLNPLGRDTGEQNFRAVRAQIAADVGNAGELTLKWQYMRNLNDTSNGLSMYEPSTVNDQGLGVFLARGVYEKGLNLPPDGNPFTIFYQPYTNFNREFISGTATYTQGLGDVDLTSITDYQHFTRNNVTEGPYFLAKTGQKQTFWQASQELRLAENKGPLRWTVGAYGLRRVSDNEQPFGLANSGLPAFFPDVDTFFDLSTTSFAAFAQTEYDIGSHFTLIGGLRYGYDRINFDYSNYIGYAPGTPDDEQLFGPPAFTYNTSTVGALARISKGDWSGKAELDFKPVSDVLIYASVNRGTKAGGFNAPSFGPYQVDALRFNEEVLTNYEGGLKQTFLDRTAHLNVSGFYYNYQGYQSFQPAGISFFLRNQQAYVKGAEADFDIRPVHGLNLAAFGSYLDAIVKDVKNPAPYDYIQSDRWMPQAPRWSFGGSVSYTTDMGSGSLTLSTNWKWNTSQFFTVFNEPVSREGTYTVGNVRASYTLDHLPLEFALYVNNVTDRLYRTFSVDDSAVDGHVESYFARPRTFGGTITYRR
jgi:iron complex outermembrane recepter protein